MPVSTTTSPTGNAATTAPSSATDTSSSFSTGAKVGVAVGVVAAFGLGLGFAYFLFRRRELSKGARVAVQPVPTHNQINEMKDYRPVNTDPYSYYGQRELPGDQPYTGPQHIYQTPHEVP